MIGALLHQLPEDHTLTLTRLDDGWGAAVLLPGGTSAIGVAGHEDPTVAASRAIQRAIPVLRKIAR